MIEGWKETELGLIPDKWEQSILSVYAEKPQYGFTDSSSNSGNAKFLRITDITDTGVNWNDVPYCNCPDIEKYKLVNGDIVFARIGATTGKSYIISNPPKAVFASYLIRVRTNAELLSNYLIYFFKSEYYWKQINSQKGTNLKGGVNGSILSELKIIVPTLPEQRKIAYILSTVQKAIEQQDKLIRHTSELKKALMQKLFTEGTRGEKQKQTEIGLLPESWEEFTIREIGNIVTGNTPSTKVSEFYGGEYNLVSPADLTDSKYVNSAHKKITELGFDQCRKLPKDTIMVGCIGYIGKLGITANDRSASNQQINSIICNNKFNPVFVYYLLSFYQKVLENRASKVTLPILNKSNFENLCFYFPELNIQLEVSSYLSKVDEKLELINTKKRFLSDLFKTLLHELMTGQRRVNEIKF